MDVKKTLGIIVLSILMKGCIKKETPFTYVDLSELNDKYKNKRITVQGLPSHIKGNYFILDNNCYIGREVRGLMYPPESIVQGDYEQALIGLAKEAGDGDKEEIKVYGIYMGDEKNRDEIEVDGKFIPINKKILARFIEVEGKFYPVYK